MKLNLCSIDKKFFRHDGNIQTVFEEFSYEFYSNNIYLMTGESGCGKTTLLNIISLLTHIDNGYIYFDDYLLSHFNEQQKAYFREKYISYASQFVHLIDKETVLENIQKTVPNVQQSLIDNYAEKLKVSHLLDKMPKVLSGGEKQRINILIALLKQSQIILLDEPTSSLDQESAKLIMDLLTEVKKDKIIIITSHNLELIEKYADHVSEIKEFNYIKEESHESTKTFSIPNQKKHFKQEFRLLPGLFVACLTLALCISMFFDLKNLAFESINKSVYNYPNLNQFIIKDNNNLDNYNTKQYFPLGKKLYNSLFNTNEYMIDNISIYLFEKDSFVKNIETDHVYISDQLANIIANKEKTYNIENLIGKEIELALYSSSNNELTKSFEISGIIKTGQAMLSKDIYCLYDDVKQFYTDNHLDEELSHYKYKILYEENDCLSLYHSMRNEGAYSFVFENILMTQQLLSIFNICFYVFIIILMIGFILYLYNYVNRDLKKCSQRHIRNLLNGYTFRDLMKNEFMNIIYNIGFVFIVVDIVIFIISMIVSDCVYIYLNMILGCCLFIFIVLILYLMIRKNIKEMEKTGIDILIK